MSDYSTISLINVTLFCFSKLEGLLSQRKMKYSRIPITRTFRGNRKGSSYRELRTNDLKEGKTMILCTSIHTMYILITIWLVPGVGGIYTPEIIKNVSGLSGNLLNDLRYYVIKNRLNLFLQLGLSLFSFLLARNCSVCRESCHDYSPKMFGSFARLSLCWRKK